MCEVYTVPTSQDQPWGSGVSAAVKKRYILAKIRPSFTVLRKLIDVNCVFSFADAKHNINSQKKEDFLGNKN